jgi:hypothetical protein
MAPRQLPTHQADQAAQADQEVLEDPEDQADQVSAQNIMHNSVRVILF